MTTKTTSRRRKTSRRRTSRREKIYYKHKAIASIEEILHSCSTQKRSRSKSRRPSGKRPSSKKIKEVVTKRSIIKDIIFSHYGTTAALALLSTQPKFVSMVTKVSLSLIKHSLSSLSYTCNVSAVLLNTVVEAISVVQDLIV